VLSLLSLLVFKYYNFVNESIWSLLSSLGLRYELHGLNWAIPVGISFFTFQAVGYLFDVYYQRIKAEKSIVDYTLFVCFFPQIFSGPISKANELLPQIKEEHKFNYQQGVQGLKFLLWGMFLKLVLADRLGLYVDKVAARYEMYVSLR
jgi:D-alanyl-lipoteichoic acid acyltransferase DltB (MBOAT superfamily)